MHDAAVQDREDGTEKAELIIVHSLLQLKSRGIGSREISAANSLVDCPAAVYAPAAA